MAENQYPAKPHFRQAAATRHDHWLVARPSIAFVPSVPSYHFAVMGSKQVKIRKCLVCNCLGQKC
jgi:hypothetical protein